MKICSQNIASKITIISHSQVLHYMLRCDLTITQEVVIQQGNTQSDGKEVEEVIVASDYNQDLQQHLQICRGCV